MAHITPMIPLLTKSFQPAVGASIFSRSVRQKQDAATDSLASCNYSDHLLKETTGGEFRVYRASIRLL